jgi:hypothetical protein
MICKKLIIFCVVFFFCCATFAQSFPDEIKAAIRNASEDYIVGIGLAKTDNDWESFMQAEDRAREEIARQISTIVRSMERKFTPSSGNSSDIISNKEDITEAYSKAYILDSYIVSHTKTSDGAWWCVIYAKKP